MKSPKPQPERPAIQAASKIFKAPRAKVACTSCRQRRVKCQTLFASNAVEHEGIMCVQCAKKGQKCDLSKSPRVGTIELRYYQQMGVANLPDMLPQSLWENHGNIEPLGVKKELDWAYRQYPADMYYPPTSSARLDVDRLSGCPDKKDWSFATDMQVTSESHMSESPKVKEEHTETKIETMGLGIYIPDIPPLVPDPLFPFSDPNATRSLA
ncbi:MAG: hypothetical protein Q9168_001491 [Polycauliona sp. 1 TL-2023]